MLCYSHAHLHVTSGLCEIEVIRITCKAPMDYMEWRYIHFTYYYYDENNAGHKLCRHKLKFGVRYVSRLLSG